MNSLSQSSTSNGTFRQQSVAVPAAMLNSVRLTVYNITFRCAWTPEATLSSTSCDGMHFDNN